MGKETDINVNINGVQLNCRAVAIIEYNGKILFQKRMQDNFWALPGGKIRIGETTEMSIRRELEEELGLKNFSIKNVCTISEYFFTFGTDKYHQYIFGHKVMVEPNEWIYKRQQFNGIEENENLMFKWLDIDKLDKDKIKPDFLKEQLTKINIKELQFISYEEKGD
jgi:8-oxo-dGTP pyrophosphatase MutT (NUDIX family)